MGSAEVINTLVSRSFEENLEFIQQDPELEYLYHVKIGFVPNMKVLLWKEMCSVFNLLLSRCLVEFS